MSINHTRSHPKWCDPRTCLSLGIENVEHRTAPFELKATVDDYLLAVGLARFDSIDPQLGYTGRDAVHLELTDVESVALDGSPLVLGTKLTAADARLLAAALDCAADQLDALAVAR